MNGIRPAHSLPPSVTETLQSSSHEFLQPSQSLHSAILSLSKYYLDPVASSISTTQQARLHETRKNRKRKRKDAEDGEEQVLRLKGIALEGFDAQQVWEQVRRVVGAVEGEVLRVWEEQKDEVSESSSSSAASEIEEIGSEEESLEESDVDAGDMEIEMSEDENEDDDFDMLDGHEEESEGGSEEDEEKEEDEAPEMRQDKFGLNDGFFSIDDFNRRTEMLEQQDYKGDPDADAASDEEDIEWDVNPLTIESSAKQGRKQRGRAQSEGLDDEDDDESEDNEDDDDEGGPTFGDMDLNAPEGASDDEDDDLDMDDGEEPENMMYKDFFDPPARKQSHKAGKQKQKQHKQPATDVAIDEEQDLLRTMAAVHRDLYSDESEDEDDIDAKQDTSNMSTHEKRKAAILAQIRELEAGNVAKRPWVLAGEARGQDRPVNAILEEDLDFERTGKPLPVITAETSEEIEQLIKRRILAGEFDEVRKRRPDEALNDSVRRGRLADITLDNPDRKGLAEEYEEDHLRKTDPNYMDKRSQKLKKEHTEIEALWKDISSKLDSLASFRYRPRPSEITIAVRTDAPAISLEDARPSGIGGDIGTFSQLAPQEVYQPGEVKEKGKIATRGGQIIDQAELSREERKRRRRREKERSKKAQGQQEMKGPKKDTAKEKKVRMAGDLKKGGVKFIGKKGEVRDIEGNEFKDGVKPGAGKYKL